jgi:hypothetical protein
MIAVFVCCLNYGTVAVDGCFFDMFVFFIRAICAESLSAILQYEPLATFATSL